MNPSAQTRTPSIVEVKLLGRLVLLVVTVILVGCTDNQSDGVIVASFEPVSVAGGQGAVLLVEQLDSVGEFEYLRVRVTVTHGGSDPIWYDSGGCGEPLVPAVVSVESGEPLHFLVSPELNSREGYTRPARPILECTQNTVPVVLEPGSALPERVFVWDVRALEPTAAGPVEVVTSFNYAFSAAEAVADRGPNELVARVPVDG